MSSSAPHKEQKVDCVQYQADHTEGDPEQATQYYAKEQGYGPEEVASHQAAPEYGLVYVVCDVAFIWEEHPLLFSCLEIYFHPPHHVYQFTTHHIF